MLLAKSGQLPHLMCTTPVFSWSKPQTIIFKSTREDQSWAQKHFHTSPKWKLAQGWEKKKSSVKMTQILLSVDISCEILYSRTSLKLGLQFLLRKDLIIIIISHFRCCWARRKQNVYKYDMYKSLWAQRAACYPVCGLFISGTKINNTVGHIVSEMSVTRY